MKRSEALEKLKREMEIVDKTFFSHEAKASAILSFVTDRLGMKPPEDSPRWDPEDNEEL